MMNERQTRTTHKPCSQCGNDALLLEENNGKCLTCAVPPLKGLTPNEKLSLSLVIEGCECDYCTSTRNKLVKSA